MLTRPNLTNVFVLVDSRHKPQELDLDFMLFLGEHGVPFSIIFTKQDKLNKTQTRTFMKAY